MKPSRILVTCPRCSHAQEEPAAAYSTRCRQCGEHFRLEDVVRSAGQPALARPAAGARQVACFQCGTVLEVSPSAQSTMCKRCSSHLDLRDYNINHTESKNFRTRGRLLLQESGCLLNTDSIFQEGIIKGKVIGRIEALGSLEIHRLAEIRGSFKAGTLIIAPDAVFRWPEPLQLANAEVAGELQANVSASGTVLLRSGSRFFGSLQAAGLRVQPGAVVVGQLRVGPPPAGSGGAPHP
jgi:cytoskeletal protein CcmA (bactofilin family)